MPEAKALAAELAALVDVLVPGDGAFPSASEVGVQAKLADRLILMRGEGAVQTLVETLATAGSPLARLEADGRTAVLARIERERPDDFLLIRNIVYLSYYESPAVHEAIRAMGFTYHATPLPVGYEVGRFDPTTDTPRHSRGVFVRTDEVRRVDLSKLDFLGGSHG
jgi:hypothetical protein